VTDQDTSRTIELLLVVTFQTLFTLFRDIIKAAQASIRDLKTVPHETLLTFSNIAGSRL